MSVTSLATTARALVAPGKGLLAADESSSTIAKRFADIGINSTEENRQAYRDLLFTAPGIETFLSGVILFDETIHQSSGDGRPFAQLLSQRGIIPGIKVDLGTVAMPGFTGETLTQGLDALGKRLAGYLQLGARFAKWRAVIHVGAGLPTDANLLLNAQDLARYAACCQEAGLVPIVEPEVLMEGDHDLETCLAVTTRTLDRVFSQLREQRVSLEALVLKCNMVTSGDHAPVQASIERVARETINALRRCVPPAVPGIAFLSGGQSPSLATQHLDAINRQGPHPWKVSFSYGRALQEPVLTSWAGEAGNRVEAQRQLVRRLRLNAAATTGTYDPVMEIDQITV
jgi:fructose-bisphosphate aldolase class I